MKIFFSVITFLLLTSISFCQVTTSGVRGTVIAKYATPAEGVTVTATHLPTGSVYSTLTQKQGNYTLPNLRSGGPYKVIFTAVGFTPETVEDLTLSLGVFLILNPVLQPSSPELGTVTVVTTKNNLRRAGINTSIAKEQLERLPTLTRSLQDFIRVSPNANGNSLAGANYRYNNLSVDGAALNDAFGFTEPEAGQVVRKQLVHPEVLQKRNP